MQRQVLIGGCLLFGLAFQIGCGDPNAPQLYPVTGTVTLDGKPLGNAGVMFFPRGATRGNACLGMTDATGKYTLAPEKGGGTGCPEGEFVVTISKMKDPPLGTANEPAPAESGSEEILSRKYWDSAESILSANVPKGGGTVDFSLVSRP